MRRRSSGENFCVATLLFARKIAVSDRVIFLCAATSATGAGHLGRCLALAEVYSASGWCVEFVLTGDAFAHLLGSDYAWWVAKPDQTVEVVGKIAPDGCDVLVIDDYARGKVFETELRG